jgi:hypothetical protein
MLGGPPLDFGLGGGPFAILLYTLGVYMWLDTCRPSGRVLLMGIIIVSLLGAIFWRIAISPILDGFNK